MLTPALIFYRAALRAPRLTRCPLVLTALHTEVGTQQVLHEYWLWKASDISQLLSSTNNKFNAELQPQKY